MSPVSQVFHTVGTIFCNKRKVKRKKEKENVVKASATLTFFLHHFAIFSLCLTWLTVNLGLDHRYSPKGTGLLIPFVVAISGTKFLTNLVLVHQNSAQLRTLSNPKQKLRDFFEKKMQVWMMLKDHDIV